MFTGSKLFSKLPAAEDGAVVVGLVGFFSIDSSSAEDIFTFAVAVPSFEPVAAEAKLPERAKKRNIICD